MAIRQSVETISLSGSDWHIHEDAAGDGESAGLHAAERGIRRLDPRGCAGQYPGGPGSGAGAEAALVWRGRSAAGGGRAQRLVVSPRLSRAGQLERQAAQAGIRRRRLRLRCLAQRAASGRACRHVPALRFRCRRYHQTGREQPFWRSGSRAYRPNSSTSWRRRMAL